MKAMPRPKMEDYTWIHAHVRKVIQQEMARMAVAENRSLSNMVATLLQEALEARGVVIPARTTVEERERDSHKDEGGR